MDDDSEKITFPDGASVTRYSDESTHIPGCTWTFGRQIDELLRPLRKLDLAKSEFALFKAVLFFDGGKKDIELSYAVLFSEFVP